MKKRCIKKLKKRVANFIQFEVQESAGLFGDFDGFNRLGLIMPTTIIMADDHITAIKRYIQRRERRFKQIDELHGCWDNETTEKWGRVAVTDTKTHFTRYYR